MRPADIQAFVDRFAPLAFPKGFGFDSFTFDDVWHYLTDDSVFSLALKKITGKGILYGPIHAQCRRSLFNGLPKQERVNLLSKKIRYFGILDPNFVLTDAEDIGMGHSVYRIETNGVQQVIKREELRHQSFFCELLRVLGWPSFQTRRVENHKGAWEISEYLGDVHLDQFIRDQSLGDVERQLACHAALGDVMGRGDRHFENYMVYQGNLLPVDISFLFWEGNEQWVQAYVAGGMGEIDALENQPERLDVFFQNYAKALAEIKSKQKEIEALIISFFGQADFVNQRLNRIDNFVREHRRLYHDAFQEMLGRRKYKMMLQEIGDVAPDSLDHWLKMYYLADKGRQSCFFLWETRSKEFKEKIEVLAKQLKIAWPACSSSGNSSF